MIRVATRIPNPLDATSHYRGLGPLGHLQRTSSSQFLFNTMDQASIPIAQLSDLAFFQRPRNYAECEGIRIFRACGVPVVIDYDDDVLAVPNDNPAHFIYDSTETKNAILNAVQDATAVIVSTPAIRERFKAIYPDQRVFVVPNALDERLHPVPKRGNLTNTILWRGSASHQRDFEVHSRAIVEFAGRNPESVFTFFGYHPWRVLDELRKSQYELQEPFENVISYIARLYQIGPKIGMVPLHDSPFNRSKSNISWLEKTWAGAVCLVPNWDEWANPGAITYDGPSNFLEKLEYLKGLSDASRAELHQQAWEYIARERVLSKVNPLREHILLAALARVPWPQGG